MLDVGKVVCLDDWLDSDEAVLTACKVDLYLVESSDSVLVVLLAGCWAFFEVAVLVA